MALEAADPPMVADDLGAERHEKRALGSDCRDGRGPDVEPDLALPDHMLWLAVRPSRADKLMI